ncbi:MAG: bifunctional riboflavin kinase/FAD synthetase [Anaerolineae bacterium]|nr:bifunctional riboflavin kinase/FAD synthetase [Anaerolineae bacterium]
MQLIDDLSKLSLRQETILTIGAFDGVHRGHQALIARVVNRARATNRLAGLLTFHPHPAVVLAPKRAPRYLTTPGEKVALLEGLGMDLVVLMRFDRELAATSAHDFMAQISTRLRLSELWIGADFALGRNREGDVPRLRLLGDQFGYAVYVVEPVVDDGAPISSSRIRALLLEGDVEEATELLGRYPRVSGQVVGGAARGRNLGFPTANLEVRPERAVPANGVYAVYAVLGRERYPAVANVGVRPSFDNGERTVETHIFDFDRDIYGCDLVVEFVARLRNERRFEDIGDLIAQIGKDMEAARAILEDPGPGSEASEQNGANCPYRYHEVEHTADRALWVWGKELRDLFVGAARGMYYVMDLEIEGEVATDWREISLEATDPEILLVDWLNELLYIGEVEGLLLVDFQIDSLTESSLEARVGGVPAEEPVRDIKAVTFHDLAVVQEEDGWSTVVTFDV